MFAKERRMTANEPVAFADEARSAFAFLEGEFGFRNIIAERTHLRWSSASVYVDVCLDERSRSIEVEVGLVGDLGSAIAELPAYRIGRPVLPHTYSLAEIVTSESDGPLPAVAEGQRAGDAFDSAALLRRFGVPFLKGTPVAFERLARSRSENAMRFTREIEKADLRSRAESAWRRRDYEEAAKCYRRLGDDRTALESRKLRYAERQLH